MQGPVGLIGQPGPPGPQGKTGPVGAKGQVVMTHSFLKTCVIGQLNKYAEIKYKLKKYNWTFLLVFTL